MASYKPKPKSKVGTPQPNTLRHMKHYYTKLHTEGFKEGNGFKGFDSVCAHFDTDAKIGSIAFLMAQTDAVKLIGGQQVSHGWTGYTIGNTFMQTGWHPVSVMSPAYEYRTETTSSDPVYKEVISK